MGGFEWILNGFEWIGFEWYQVFGIAICSGLGFSTIITLLVTPSFLMVLENMRDIREKGRSFVLSIPNRIRGR